MTPYEAALGAWPLPEGMAPAPSPQGFYDVVKGDAIHGAMFFGDIPTQKAANWNKTLEAGGVLVGDEVNVTLDVEFTKKAPQHASN